MNSRSRHTSCWMTSSQRWSRVPLPLSSCLSYKDWVMRFWYSTRLAWNLQSTSCNQLNSTRYWKFKIIRPLVNHWWRIIASISFCKKVYWWHLYVCMFNFPHTNNRKRKNNSWSSITFEEHSLSIKGWHNIAQCSWIFNGSRKSSSHG